MYNLIPYISFYFPSITHFYFATVPSLIHSRSIRLSLHGRDWSVDFKDKLFPVPVKNSFESSQFEPLYRVPRSHTWTNTVDVSVCFMYDRYFTIVKGCAFSTTRFHSHDTFSRWLIYWDFLSACGDDKDGTLNISTLLHNDQQKLDKVTFYLGAREKMSPAFTMKNSVTRLLFPCEKQWQWFWREKSMWR